MSFLWATGVFLLSSMTSSKIETPFYFDHMDKAIHLVLFYIGGILLAVTLRKSYRLSPVFLILITVLVLSVYGMLDEWHQLLVEGRTGADVGDWLADTVGASLGALTTLMFRNYVRRGNSERPA